MNLNSDVRSQLMSLAGISDPADFDRMVRELAPQDAASGVSAGPTRERVGIGAPEMANLVRIWRYQIRILGGSNCTPDCGDGIVACYT